MTDVMTYLITLPEFFRWYCPLVNVTDWELMNTFYLYGVNLLNTETILGGQELYLKSTGTAVGCKAAFAKGHCWKCRSCDAHWPKLTFSMHNHCKEMAEKQWVPCHRHSVSLEVLYHKLIFVPVVCIESAGIEPAQPENDFNMHAPWDK